MPVTMSRVSRCHGCHDVTGVSADPTGLCSRASLFETRFQIDLVRCARNAPHLKISGEKRI